MKHILILIAVVLSIALAGCPGGPPAGGIVGFHGELTVSDGEFHMEGEVMNTGQVSPPPEFNNVTVYLYAEDGTLIKSESIDSFEASTTITMHSQQVPKYVIIDSPDFWQYDIQVDYWKLVTESNGTYRQEVVTERNEFPVELSEQEAEQS